MFSAGKLGQEDGAKNTENSRIVKNCYFGGEGALFWVGEERHHPLEYNWINNVWAFDEEIIGFEIFQSIDIPGSFHRIPYSSSG